MRSATRTTWRRTGWAWPALALLVLAGGCGEEPVPATWAGYDASGNALEPVTPPARLPNLILVVIDSLRHDALPPATAGETDPAAVPMPAFARLAAQGIRFTEATANAPWTLPSMASLLTGLLPSEHGLHAMGSGARLLPAITTFAEVLAGTYGYDTAAFTAGPWLEADGRSVLQGFATIEYDYSLQTTSLLAEKWLRYRDPSRPFFLLLHTLDAHAPYGASNHRWPPRLPAGGRLTPEQVRALTPAGLRRVLELDWDAIADVRATLGPEATLVYQRYAYEGFAADPDPELARELADAYWGGVRWTDGGLEATLAALAEQGLLEDTLLVVTSDHGETFGEHGTLGHGLQLHEELVRVPLVMRGPPPLDQPGLMAEPVGLVDVLPTFLDLAGLSPLTGIEGRSALPVLRGEAPGRGVLMEERLNHDSTGTQADKVLVGVRTPSFKYVLEYDARTGAAVERAWDLLLDPDETEDLGAGRGRLDGVVFDAVTCAAIERVRGRVWRDREEATAGSAYTVPYGARPHTRPPRPPAPCLTDGG